MKINQNITLAEETHHARRLVAKASVKLFPLFSQNLFFISQFHF